MRFAVFIATVFIFTFLSAYSAAVAEDSSGGVKIPEGMELKKSGGVNILIPKGAKINRVGSVNLIEGTDEYAAQKFEIVEKRLQQIEDKQKEMDSRITVLENCAKEGK